MFCLLLCLLVVPIQCPVWMLRAFFAGCGGQVTKPGIIGTTNFMGKYSEEANCTWNITAPPGNVIVLRWAQWVFTVLNLYRTVRSYLFVQEVPSQPAGSRPCSKTYQRPYSKFLALQFLSLSDRSCLPWNFIQTSWSPVCSLLLYVCKYANMW